MGLGQQEQEHEHGHCAVSLHCRRRDGTTHRPVSATGGIDGHPDQGGRDGVLRGRRRRHACLAGCGCDRSHGLFAVAERREVSCPGHPRAVGCEADVAEYVGHRAETEARPGALRSVQTAWLG